MKMKLFAAFLFCENALATCPAFPKWQKFMDQGKYYEAYFLATGLGDPFQETGKTDEAKEYRQKYKATPLCMRYFEAEPDYRRGDLEHAVFYASRGWSYFSYDYKDDQPEIMHKFVHWAIELGEREFAANKMGPANEAIRWAASLMKYKITQCPCENHYSRVAELVGDVAIKLGDSQDALGWYQKFDISTYSPEIKNKIAFAKGQMPAYKMPLRSYQPITNCSLEPPKPAPTPIIPVSLEMVKIPAGSFKMGSPLNEKGRDSGELQHKVTFTKDFYLSKYEVTQAQWKAVMGSESTNCYNNYPLGSIDKPVVCVSWNEVKFFIERLNKRGDEKYRLPSEAEWEYAARGGTKSTNYWGKIEDTCKYENVADESVDFYGWGRINCNDHSLFTSSVGSFLPNPYGLYDMGGNVSEWVEDSFTSSYDSESLTDPKPRTGESFGNRMIRGGNWYSGKESLIRAAYRGFSKDTNQINTVGFRLVKIN
jgi:formylglycine-generating enzyme required for sulfatase activity